MRERLSEGTIYFSSQTRTEKCCKIITKRGTFFSVQIIPDKARIERKNCLVFFCLDIYNLTIRDLHFSVWTISFHNWRPVFFCLDNIISQLETSWDRASDVILPAISFNIFFMVRSYPPAER